MNPMRIAPLHNSDVAFWVLFVIMKLVEIFVYLVIRCMEDEEVAIYGH